MNRLDLFLLARDRARDAFAASPFMFPLDSVIGQLDYLIDLELGRRQDRELVHTLDLGLIAARDIEPLDRALAELLHDVSNEARHM